VAGRSFGWLDPFRRPTRDDERLPETLTGLRFVIFARLMPSCRPNYAMCRAHALERPRGNVKRYLADTFAMVVFSIVIGAFVELVITGLTIEQTIKIRAAAIPVSLLIGRPYGIYRDWVFRRVGGAEKTLLQKILLDTFINLTFQIPLYALILALNGATFLQVLTAVTSILVIVGFSGRPYGVFLSGCRRLFRVPDTR
jgi:hypothetical protein